MSGFQGGNGGNGGNRGGREATPFMKMISNDYKIYELKGKAFYASFITPSTQADGYQEYSLDLVFDVNENAQVVQQINGLVKQALAQFYPRVPEPLIKLPIVDNRIPRVDGKDHPAFKANKFSCRPHTKVERNPKVIVKDDTDPRGYRDFSPLQDSHKIYDGMDVWVSVKIGAIEGASGKYGATMYLNGVVVLGTGDRVEMRSGDSVENIFGNFLGMTAGGNFQGNGYANQNGGQNFQQNSQNYGNQGQQNYGQNMNGQNNMQGNGYNNQGQQQYGNQGGQQYGNQGGQQYGNQGGQQYGNQGNFGQNNNGGSLV